jgi:putative DNA primase/helicase
MEQTIFQDAALRLAEQGKPVFPLAERQKIPVHKGGFHNATTDPDQIRAWWTENPNYNVAVPTGDASGYVVIDVDGTRGEQSLVELEQELGSLPPTVTQITPGKITGGQHVGKGRQLFFRKNNDQDFRCQQDIAPKIDIKGNGGYCVVPPSLHPDHPAGETGTYQFAEGRSFEDIEPAELPPAWVAWLLEGQGKKRCKNTAPADHDLPPASEAIIEACRQVVSKTKPAIQGKGGDKQTYSVARVIFFSFGLSEAEGRPMLDEYNQRCVPPWSEEELLHKINCAIAHTGKKPRGWKRYEKPIEGEYYPPYGTFVLNPNRTQPIALAFRRDCCSHEESFLLQCYAGDFYYWSENQYQQIAIDSIKGALLDWMTRAVMLKGDLDHPQSVKPIPFPAKNSTVNDVLEALKAICWVDSEAVESGDWIGNADEIPMTTPPIFTQNCVYDWRTGEGHPCSPRWFNLSCVNATIEGDTPEPKRWLQFLDELWGDDQESKDQLHEFMGLCLTLDTSFHKILLIVGPTRSGKGTIFRIMRVILGAENIAAPTTDSLVHRFGLQPLLGKPLAIIGDARFSGRDIQIVIERLLTLTGDDAITVDRKNRDPVSVLLPTRFMIGANEMPRLPDNAGAIANRIQPLQLTRSFLGHEDRGLDTALAQEKAGILALMIEGLRRLYRQGFTEPAYQKALIQDLEELGSPIRPFIRERCVLGADQQVTITALWSAWLKWCSDQDQQQPFSTSSVFGRSLRSCCPEISKKKSRSEDNYYVGIGLRSSQRSLRILKATATGDVTPTNGDDEGGDKSLEATG